jgi:hypothetical protein
MTLSPERKKEYDKERYHLRRRLALEYLGGKCTKCETVENLQIDHKYWTDKTLRFSTYFSYSLKKFYRELDKCQLLCFPCHIEKSKGDFQDRRLSGLPY